MIDELLVRYVEALIYQGGRGEHGVRAVGARMVAMKAASDNAGNVIGELQLVYKQGPPGGDHQGNFRDRRRLRRLIGSTIFALRKQPWQRKHRSVHRAVVDGSSPRGHAQRL